MYVSFCDTHFVMSFGIFCYCSFIYLPFNKPVTMYKTKNEVLKVCDVQISYRPKIHPYDRPKIISSLDIYNFFKENEIFNPDTVEYKEYFKILLLNNSCKVLGVLHHSEGGYNQTTFDLKQIMQAIILSNASYIALCHNHPSGSIKPSSEDNSITKKIKQACEFFDVRLVDHVIFTPYIYYSYADDGMLE